MKPTHLITLKKLGCGRWYIRVYKQTYFLFGLITLQELVRKAVGNAFETNSVARTYLKNNSCDIQWL